MIPDLPELDQSQNIIECPKTNPPKIFEYSPTTVWVIYLVLVLRYLMYKNALPLSAGKVEKLILNRDPDTDQFQNLVDWSLA